MTAGGLDSTHAVCHSCRLLTMSYCSTTETEFCFINGQVSSRLYIIANSIDMEQF